MKLPSTFANNKHIYALIETPAGSSAKYNFDEKTKLFRLKKILPEGIVFPFHFGFIPHTKAEDGDPVDVLVLMDALSWPGCFMECKVLGVIEAEQTEDDKTARNDRIIAAAIASRRYEEANDLFSIDPYLVDEIINFLESYNRLEKKEFKVLGKQGSDKAINLIKKQITDGNIK